VRTALIALRHALSALTEGPERLGRAERGVLEDILQAGLRDLESHALAPSEEAVPLTVAELCRPVRRWAADVGVSLGLDLPPGLVVQARPRVVEEALELMWRAAAAPGAALVLGGARAGDRAELWFRAAADDGGRPPAPVLVAPGRIGAVPAVDLAALRRMLGGDGASLEEHPGPPGPALVLRLPLAPVRSGPGGLGDAGDGSRGLGGAGGDGSGRAPDQLDPQPGAARQAVDDVA
jgi:hypothetical protein